MKNNSNSIASSMDAILKNPEFKSMFSSSSMLEKLAFKKVSDENLPTEVEIEFSNELSKEPLQSQPAVETSLEATANVKADCLSCGKKRVGWTEAMGTCKCSAQSGCNPMVGCSDNCSCGCKTKQAGVSMSSDMLVKSAFDALLKASSDLEDAGFERLSAHALVLMNNLVVEAKAKKDKKDDKKKDKEKADAAKAKERAKAEKDKNAAKDKAMKEKEKMLKEKAKDKLEKVKDSKKKK